MNALDYILDAVLLATIFLQFRGRRLTVRYLALPVAIVVYFLFAYLKGVPTAGNDKPQPGVAATTATARPPVVTATAAR